MESEAIIKVLNLRKWFNLRRRIFNFSKVAQLYIRAVDDVSFSIRRKEILGLVGESGCGKTTTGRLLTRLIEPTGGQLFFEDRDITHLKGEELRRLRSKMQIVFQDPYSSLNPRMTVEQILMEPILVHKLMKDKQKIRQKIKIALETVGIIPPEEFLASNLFLL